MVFLLLWAVCAPFLLDIGSGEVPISLFFLAADEIGPDAGEEDAAPKLEALDKGFRDIGNEDAFDVGTGLDIGFREMGVETPGLRAVALALAVGVDAVLVVEFPGILVFTLTVTFILSEFTFSACCMISLKFN